MFDFSVVVAIHNFALLSFTAEQNVIIPSRLFPKVIIQFVLTTSKLPLMPCVGGCVKEMSNASAGMRLRAGSFISLLLRTLLVCNSHTIGLDFALGHYFRDD